MGWASVCAGKSGSRNGAGVSPIYGTRGGGEGSEGNATEVCLSSHDSSLSRSEGSEEEVYHMPSV